MTDPRIFTPASTPAEAVAQLEAWAAAPNVRLLSEKPHPPGPVDLAGGAEAGGPGGARRKIAAICLDHGVRALLTMDRDFSRFPALTTRSLLA